MGLSNLGIFHTVIGIIAIVAALVSLINFGRINLDKRSGIVYFYTTVVTSLTALGFTKHGNFNPGHIFSLFIVALVAIAFLLHQKKKGNTKARYFENFLLSFSFFLSLVPTVNETLTRVPLGHPIAKDPTAPIIQQVLLVFFALFIIGSVLQFIRQRKINRSGSETN